MTLRKLYPVGVLFFLAACVSALSAAEPSSPDPEGAAAKAREIRSVALSSAPVAPVEPFRTRRKSIIERQTPAPAPVFTEPEPKLSETKIKEKETPSARVPVAPVVPVKEPKVPAVEKEPVVPVKEPKVLAVEKEPVAPVKEPKVPVIEKEPVIPPAPPVIPEPETKSKESFSAPVPSDPVLSTESSRGRRKTILDKQPVVPVPPRKTPAVVPPPKKLPKARIVAKEAPVKPPKPAKLSAVKTERCLQQARTAYNSGDLGEAEDKLNECLAAEPLNLTASEMKNKIAILRERMLAVQEDVADEYYHSAEYFYEKGNLPEALLWSERSVKLNRKSPLSRMLYQALQQDKANTLLKVNKDDKKLLEAGIGYFLAEDFDDAVAVFRALQRNYPEMNDFLSSAIIHSGDPKNSKRSREYIQAALDNMKMERYKNAQEALYLALQMDTTNLYARMVLEQVNLELGVSSSLVPASASGTAFPK